MMPFDMLEGAITGTRPQWLVLALLLPFVGFGLARSWGPAAVAGARRALVLVSIELALAVIAGWTVFAVSAFVALLPVLGAAASRERVRSVRGTMPWLLALAFAAPVVLATHLSPEALAVAWLLALPALAALRGLVEPLAPAVRAWRDSWHVEAWADELEPSR